MSNMSHPRQHQKPVPASPASDPTNADGDRTTVQGGKLVVIPAEKKQE